MVERAEADYLAYLAGKEPSKSMLDTLNTTRDVLARYGAPNVKITFIPGWRLDEIDREQQLKTNAIARDLNDRNLPYDQIIAGEQTAVGFTENNVIRAFLSSGDFCPHFWADPEKDKDYNSVGAVLAFKAAAYVAIDLVPREILLSRDPDVIADFVKDTLEIAQEIPIDRKFQNELNQYAAELKSYLEGKQDLSVVGKGAKVMLKDDNSFYIYANITEHDLALDTIVKKATDDFIREMKRHCPWFVHPNKWSHAWQEFFRSTQPAGADFKNAVWLTRSFVDSQLAANYFLEEQKVIEENKAQRLALQEEDERRALLEKDELDDIDISYQAAQALERFAIDDQPRAAKRSKSVVGGSKKRSFKEYD